MSPGIIALLLGTSLAGGMLLVGALFGLAVIRRWDLGSGSERQLRLERSTYLISTLVANACVFELGLLLLFIHMAEDMHSLFTGAMCAAGTLGVNAYGYPALMTKIGVFMLASVWLAMNHADSRSPVYPLIRPKYWLLLMTAPLVMADGALTGLYILNLNPDVITSCCGTLFSAKSEGSRGPGLFDLDMVKVAWAAGVIWILTLAYSAYVYRTGRGGQGFGIMGLLMLFTGLLAAIICVSPYVYELPTHRCPFCLLKKEYAYLGYPYFGALLLGASASAGAGGLGLFKARLGSDRMIKTLAMTGLVGFALWGCASLIIVYSSGLSLL